MTSILKRSSLYLLALLLLLFTCYPFVYMISTALKSQTQFYEAPFSLFTSFNFENIQLVFEMGLTKYVTNSVLITVVSVLAVMLFASMASYPLSRMKFKLNGFIYILFIAGMMLPIHATLIPIFKLTQTLGMYDSLWALLGPYIAFSLPISVFILTQFMRDIPKSLEEAAELDGASHFSIFSKVILPMVSPALMTVLIYNFIHLWNEFIFALVLISTPERMTLPLGLQNFKGEFSVNIPGLMMALTLASIPVLLIYLFSQEKVTIGFGWWSSKRVI